ncbi:unnamed protein product [Closterium sp. Yama58-4]|nr:unnamed protein product [Closterium sp. Yama58-4]
MEGAQSEGAAPRVAVAASSELAAGEANGGDARADGGALSADNGARGEDEKGGGGERDESRVEKKSREGGSDKRDGEGEKRDGGEKREGGKGAEDREGGEEKEGLSSGKVSVNATNGETSAQDAKPESNNVINGDASAQDGKPLSKNAQKKLAKRQAMQERKERTREEARIAREAQQKRAEQEAAAAEASMTPEERAEAAVRQREKAEARRVAEAERRKAWAEKAEKGPGLIIDLEFEELMGERELSSLQQQVMFSYALNHRAPSPCRLTLSGLPPASPFLLRLQRIAGFDSWHGVTVEPRSYIEAWAGREGELVYLTADAEEEVGEVEAGKVYVVGGIVDHNRYKGLTKGKAEKQGIKTARLPIGKYLNLKTSKAGTDDSARFTSFEREQEGNDAEERRRTAAGRQAGGRPGVSFSAAGRNGDNSFNGVFLLLLLNLLAFLADHFLRLPVWSSLYLHHASPRWYQFVTSTFCHAGWSHLSSNLFFLYIFGRLVEEEEGTLGLWVTYLVTGAGSNLVSWLLLPSYTVSVGASGAVFGLFVVSVLTRLQWN